MQSARNTVCTLVCPSPRLDRYENGTVTVRLRDRAYVHVESSVYEPTPHITHIDRTIIRGYYLQSTVGPALLWEDMRKPFELRKHWQLNAMLSPYLPAEPLPAELECKLSVIPPGYQRMRIGADILLVNIAGGNVVDAMYDIRTPAV